MIKLLPISNCYDCKYRLEYSCCSLVEEPGEKKRDFWIYKVLSSGEGIGIPRWCPLKTKRKRKTSSRRMV